MSRPKILVVEDNKPDVFLIREALAVSGIIADMYFVNDGSQAAQFFDGSDRDMAAPCPDLVLLDLNLPKETGEDVLLHMRKSVRCKNARVLVVTSSDSVSDRKAMEALGVSGFFRKPSEYAEYLKLGSIVKALLSDCQTANSGNDLA